MIQLLQYSVVAGVQARRQEREVRERGRGIVGEEGRANEGMGGNDQGKQRRGREREREVERTTKEGMEEEDKGGENIRGKIKGIWKKGRNRIERDREGLDTGIKKRVG